MEISIYRNGNIVAHVRDKKCGNTAMYISARFSFWWHGTCDDTTTAVPLDPAASASRLAKRGEQIRPMRETCARRPYAGGRLMPIRA
jgi:hypothetical protein